MVGICSGTHNDVDRTSGFVVTRNDFDHLNNMWSEKTACQGVRYLVSSLVGYSW